MTMGEKRPPRSLLRAQDREFWELCGHGELHLQKCRSCGHIPWPVVEKCENCGAEQLEFEKMSGKGKLRSWCTFVQDYYRGGGMPVPYDTIVVELEEGPWFLSNPQGFATSDAAHGMDVKAAFLPCEDEHGEYNLPVFEKA